MKNRDENNSSNGVLRFAMAPDGTSAGMTFDLEKNGIAPIPITRDTRIAWNWKVSSVDRMNGFWIQLNVIDTRNQFKCGTRYVNWVSLTHDAIVYYDPPLRWIYHVARPIEYLEKRVDDFSDGGLVLTSIDLFLSHSPFVEAWLDNLWIGKGEPPDEINVSRMAGMKPLGAASQLTGFSYGYLNPDDIPDRIDIYPDRAEILINPHTWIDNHLAITDTRTLSPTAIDAPVYQQIPFLPQRGAGTVAIGDLDGDGLNDLLFSFDDGGGTLFFRNRWPRGRFERAAADSVLVQDGQHSYGSELCDFDMDGDLDVLLVVPFCRRARFGGLKLLENNNGSFRDVTRQVGLASHGTFTARFGDVNGDGAPDLIVSDKCAGSYGDPRYHGIVLYKNTGHGEFQLADGAIPLPLDLRAGGIALADFDNDGDLDLYLSLYEKVGKIALPPNRLLLNDGTGTFEDYTERSGTGCINRSGSVLVEDFDNDGWMDIYVPNKDGSSIYYHNLGNAEFEDLTLNSTFVFVGRVGGGTAVDMDRDGDMDIVLLDKESRSLRLLENAMGHENAYIDVVVRGTLNNQPGIGAKVWVYEAGRRGEAEYLLGYREMPGAGGGPQYSPPVAHFGVGSRSSVDIEVEFPRTGDAPAFPTFVTGAKTNQTIRVLEARSIWVRIVRSELVENASFWIEERVCTIPVWIIMVAAFGIVLIAGVHRRSSVSVEERRIVGIFVWSVATVVIVGALIRSWQWAVAIVAIAAGSTFFYHKIVSFAVGLMPPHYRRRAENSVLQSITNLGHDDAEFRFFGAMDEYSDDEIRRRVEKAGRSLGHLILRMRILTPGNPVTRLLREEVALIRSYTHRRGALPRGRIMEARDRIVGHLREYREQWRWRLSINIRDALRELEGMVAADARGAGIEMVFNSGRDVGEVHVHLRRREFDAVFRNLFYNSLCAMEGGREKRIHVELGKPTMYLTVRWADTGSGVSRDVRETLFKEPVKSMGGGSGRGLWDAQALLKQRGDGSIWVEDACEGEGAVFCVKLLVVEPPSSECVDG